VAIQTVNDSTLGSFFIGNKNDGEYNVTVKVSNHPDPTIGNSTTFKPITIKYCNAVAPNVTAKFPGIRDSLDFKRNFTVNATGGVCCESSCSSGTIMIDLDIFDNNSIEVFTSSSSSGDIPYSFSDGTYTWRVKASLGSLSTEITGSFNVCIGTSASGLILSPITRTVNIEDKEVLHFNWTLASWGNNCRSHSGSYSFYFHGSLIATGVNFTNPSGLTQSFKYTPTSSGLLEWVVVATNDEGKLISNSSILNATSQTCTSVSAQSPTLLSPDATYSNVIATSVSFLWTSNSFGVSCKGNYESTQKQLVVLIHNTTTTLAQANPARR